VKLATIADADPATGMVISAWVLPDDFVIPPDWTETPVSAFMGAVATPEQLAEAAHHVGLAVESEGEML
jgi:hypothetical protein